MVKKIAFLLVIFLLFLSSCSGVDPIAWNAEIISIYNKTLDDIEDFQDLISLETIGDTVVNRHIVEKGNLAIVDLEKSIKYVSEGNIPSGAEDCQAAMIEMLEAAKVQIGIGLRFTQFLGHTTEAQVDEYADKYDLASVNTAKKVDAFSNIQRQFTDNESVALKR